MSTVQLLEAIDYQHGWILGQKKVRKMRHSAEPFPQVKMHAHKMILIL